MIVHCNHLCRALNCTLPLSQASLKPRYNWNFVSNLSTTCDAEKSHTGPMTSVVYYRYQSFNSNCFVVSSPIYVWLSSAYVAVCHNLLRWSMKSRAESDSVLSIRAESETIWWIKIFSTQCTNPLTSCEIIVAGRFVIPVCIKTTRAVTSPFIRTVWFRRRRIGKQEPARIVQWRHRCAFGQIWPDVGEYPHSFCCVGGPRKWGSSLRNFVVILHRRGDIASVHVYFRKWRSSLITGCSAVGECSH